MDNIQSMFTNLIPVANIIRADTAYTSETSEYEYDEDFEMLVRAFLRDMDYTSVNQAALNIVYSTLNVGLISLPFLASEGGIIAYLLAILVVSVVSAYTSIMVIAMAQEQQGCLYVE